MKYLSITLIVFFSLTSFSQKDYTRYHNAWRLGLNGGASWQTADVRSCYGGAGGFTLERGLGENSHSIFSFAIRGRYLTANTYGMDLNRNYNVKENDALNGVYNPKVNFLDTALKGRGYIFDNYKMTYNEGSLELQLSFNRLRERKHVILNLWGGVGVTSFKTKMDLLNADGKLYDFSKIDSTGNKSKALSNYNALIDKKYESDAFGSKNSTIVLLAPSAGVGLGYQFGPGFSMILEYKVTLPQGTNADLLDGKFANNNDNIGGNNDYYHYAGINLLFTLRSKKKHAANTNQTQTTTYSTPTNTVANINNTNTPPTNTIVSNNQSQVTEIKPIITFVLPETQNKIVTTNTYTFVAKVLNIANTNQIAIKFNNSVITNYGYDAYNKLINFTTALVKGNNTLQISANNSAGNDVQQSTIVYQTTTIPTTTTAPVKNLPPTIVITNPATQNATSQNASYNVVASIGNVASANAFLVKLNNVQTTNFNYNTQTKQLNIPVNLVSGNNVVSIMASNNYGNDTKVCTINYMNSVVQNTTSSVTSAPIISLISPAVTSTVSLSNAYNCEFQVQNITSTANTQVKVNGLILNNLNYNTSSKLLLFTANLNAGSNTVEVLATNQSGTDSKTVTIKYKPKETVLPVPSIAFTNPSNGMGASTTSNYIYKASITNISSMAELVVKHNNTIITNYSFNAGLLSYNATLQNGSNTLEILATNNGGSSQANATVTYSQRVVKTPPTIVFNSPAASPYSALTPSYVFNANITNINSVTGLTVKFNNTLISNYTFANGMLAYNATLQGGDNTLDITATNADGSAQKTAIVKRAVRENKNPPVLNLITPAQLSVITETINNQFKLEVLNVTNKQNIEVLVNGVRDTTINFSAVNKSLDFVSTLHMGTNTIDVKATNNFGTDTKTFDVNYRKHVETVMAPEITFSSPLINGGTVLTPSYSYKAKITNVQNQSNLLVKHNGATISSYNFDGLNFEYNGALVSGNNTLEITATTAGGSVQKAVNVIRAVRENKNPPVLNLITPAQLSVITETINNQFKLEVLNVTSKQNIEVLVNGLRDTTINFSSVNKLVNFVSTLHMGANTISVKATNNFGTDIKTFDVNYRKHVETVMVPEITFSNPQSNNGTSQIPTYSYKAKISNVQNQSNLVVKHNGATISNYSFDGLNFEYTTALVSGNNTLEITATSNGQSDAELASVVYKPVVLQTKTLPKVTIISPTNNQVYHSKIFNFLFNVTNASQNQIEIYLNNIQIPTFAFANTNGSFSHNLEIGLNTLLIKATTPSGSDSKTVQLIFTPERTSNDTIIITDPNIVNQPIDTNKYYKVCHIPPGNHQNPQSIIIPKSAWPAHQAHGDTKGTCPQNRVTEVKEGIKPRTIQNQKGLETIKDSVNKVVEPILETAPTQSAPRTIRPR